MGYKNIKVIKVIKVIALLLLWAALSSCAQVKDTAGTAMNNNVVIPPMFGKTESVVTLPPQELVQIDKEVERDKKDILGFWASGSETLFFTEDELIFTNEEICETKAWKINLNGNKKILTIGQWNHYYTLENDQLDLGNSGEVFTRLDYTIEQVELTEHYVYDRSLHTETNSGISFNGDISYAPAGDLVNVYYINTGTKYYSGGLLNGKKSGSGTIFFGNGYEKLNATFKEDLLNGLCTEYYFGNEKKVKEICTYKNGNLLGQYTSYYQNGNKMFKGEYKDGRLMGPFIEYFENGYAKRKGNYSDPLFGSYGVNGQVNEYNEKGILVYEGNVKAGVYDGKGKLYHDNGKLKYEGAFANGMYDGKGSLYNIEGLLLYSGKWKKGEFVE